MKGDKKKILMVVGGTGGHIYPGIALTRQLVEKEPGVSVEFVVDRKPLAFEVLFKEGYPVHKITSEPFPRKCFLYICRFIFKMVRGLIESVFLLRKLKPDIVVAFGAYISVPVVIAAEFLKIPVVLHEQNYFPGLANRFLTFLAKKVAVSYKSSIEYFPPHKTVLTGNPLRKELFEVDRKEGLEFFKLDEGKLNILVFGGSLGSESINISVVGILPYLEEINEQLQFVHICGDMDFQNIIGEYSKFGYTARVFRYIKDMEYAYSIADIIIARAGATTIAEITALGIPSILIPYPHATSMHQLLNTIPLTKTGGGICYNEEKLSGEGLALRLIPLIRDSNIRRGMSIKAGILKERFINAAEKLANVVITEMQN